MFWLADCTKITEGWFTVEENIIDKNMGISILENTTKNLWMKESIFLKDMYLGPQLLLFLLLLLLHPYLASALTVESRMARDELTEDYGN